MNIILAAVNKRLFFRPSVLQKTSLLTSVLVNTDLNQLLDLIISKKNNYKGNLTFINVVDFSWLQ